MKSTDEFKSPGKVSERIVGIHLSLLDGLFKPGPGHLRFLVETTGKPIDCRVRHDPNRQCVGSDTDRP